MSSHSQKFPEMDKGLRKGRCPYDGYQRGYGLQFTKLKDTLNSDDLFKRARSVSQDRTVLNEFAIWNIYLIIVFYMSKIPSGHIVEYGSYLGGNAIFMAYLARELYPGMKVYALDTYEGMPSTDLGVDLHRKGDFSDASFENLQSYIDELKLDNLVLVKGLIENTNEEVMRMAGAISLAYIDCDIAPAIKASYDGVKPYMVEGGYIVFDDATLSSCLGATEVVEDLVIRRDGLNSEQIFPHFVFRSFSADTIQSNDSEVD